MFVTISKLIPEVFVNVSIFDPVCVGKIHSGGYEQLTGINFYRKCETGDGCLCKKLEQGLVSKTGCEKFLREVHPVLLPRCAY